MKTIQLIIEAAILLTLIIVCVLLAGKRTVAVDGDVQLSHSQVSDIVDAIEGEGGGEGGASVKIDKVQMDQLVEAARDADGKETEWGYKVRLLDTFGEQDADLKLHSENGWEFFATSHAGSDRFIQVYYRKRIK